MGVTVKPTAYISWVPLGKISLKFTEAYISWLPMGTISLRPQIAASIVPPAETQVTVTVDAKRQVALANEVTADSFRKVAASNEAFADTQRNVRSAHIAWASGDLLRQVAQTNTATADTARTLNGEWAAIRSDTSRILSPNYCVCRVGTWRRVNRTDTALFDTIRIPGIRNAVMGDASRLVGRGNPTAAPTLRTVVKQEAVLADTSIRVPIVLEYVERRRNMLKSKRLKAAAMPDIMQNFHDHGIRSFSTTLGELTLSDTFTLETVQPMEIDDAVQGQILDYSFHFLVEETSQRDLVQTVKGMYSRDILLYTAIHISVEEANVSYYVQEISCALGLEADMACDDFIPSQDYQDSGMTYQDFISSLFGWTSKLPQRQINVFIRGDTLHVIQRGLERSVLDITDWPHSRPTIDKKLVRSIWHSSNNENGDNHAHNEEDDEPVPFSGTISLGEISRTYQNGFLVRETNEDGYTEYTYDNEYLSSKRTHNKDGSTSQTRYLYAETDRDVYLFKEQERSTDPINDGRTHNEYDWTDWNNENGTERITYHAPLGYGWYATTVYVDGALEGSSLSQGKPGGKASRFTIDQSNLSLGAHYLSYYDEDGTAPAFTSLIDTEFPVKGEEYLQMLTQAIEWLNRKVQETVTVEVHANIRDGVPDVDHIVDFTERIRFDGNEYFLVSNAVELTPRSLKQTIKMTRWYG